jgi:ribosomal protein S12 methylthiotransferase accessory factor
MPQLGISRVTDITRLDRLGLPVFASIRPRGLTLRVHAGKGVAAIDAKVGALMEAIEFAAAEPHASRWRSSVASSVDISRQLGGDVRFVDLAPRFGVPVAPSQAFRTVACEELRSGRKVRLPAELVFFPCDSPGGVFSCTTNGLASGNSIEEASLHAVLEVLERDALSMNHPRDASSLVEPASVPEPFARLSDAWKALGIDLVVRHVPNDFDLPCFEATLFEKGSTDVNLASGSGLHLDRQIALARAICEAAQSRLSHVHGGRDDITAFFSKYADMRPETRLRHETRTLDRLLDGRRRLGFTDVPHVSCERRTIARVLEDVLDRLVGAGFGVVYRHRFAVELGDLHVVKVVVPKCENVEDDPNRIGPRLFERITGDG